MIDWSSGPAVRSRLASFSKRVANVWQRVPPIWLGLRVALSLAVHGPQSSDFAKLLAQYRGTEAEAAIRELASRPDGRLFDGANLRAAGTDLWDLGAAALLHLEAALVEVGYVPGDAHILAQGHFRGTLNSPGETRMLNAIAQAKASGDRPLFEFFRDYQLVRAAVMFLPPAGGSELTRSALSMLLAPVVPEVTSRSSVWDGVFAGAALVAESPGRAIVALVSDGWDNASWFDRPRAFKRLQRLGLPIDVVAVPFATSSRLSDIVAGDVSLRPAATLTGGHVANSTDADLDRQLADRFTALRQSYILTYTPENVKPQKDGWHEIKVRLRSGVKGSVQARPGYYEPAKK